VASRRCVYKGIQFDSKAEAGFFIHLLDQEKKGLISDIERQPSWPLYAAEFGKNMMGLDAREWPNMIPYKPIGKYTADFRYLDHEREEYIVVDVKGQVPGTRTLKNGTKRRTSGGQGWTAFRLRRTILKANYGIDVLVVPGAEYTQLANKAGVK
jgi:hypothetical protein